MSDEQRRETIRRLVEASRGAVYGNHQLEVATFDCSEFVRHVHDELLGDND